MIMLTDLPAEILHRVCAQLSSSTDVCNFRLVCRAFGHTGLLSLAPTVSFTLSRRGLDRLRDISSHPVLRHYVLSLICLIEVLRPYGSHELWKQKIDWPGQDADVDEDEDYPENAPEVSDATISDRWSVYQSLLASQEQVFSELKSSRMRTEFQRLSNLTHLRVKYSDSPNGLIHDTDPKVVKRRDVVGWLHHPFYPFDDESQYIGLTGIEPLRLLSRALRPQLSSLQVDKLDINFFNCEESELDAIRQIESIQIGLTYNDPDNEWVGDTSWVLARSRFKAFLCSTKRLKSINLGFYEESGHTIYTGTLGILPAEYTWPRLRKLQLSKIQITATHFLDLLRSHKETLKHIGLEDCELFSESTNLPQHLQAQVKWSDILYPLAADFSLETCVLAGYFRLSLHATSYHGTHMHDVVENIKLCVGETIEIVVCSKELDGFLRHGLQECESISVEDVKRGIIEDLMDHPPKRPWSSWPVEIATRYIHHLKAFSLVTETSSWGKSWEPPEKEAWGK
ncbi:hypothetical protein V2G26_005311 [Clonostachys chloroleuca]